MNQQANERIHNEAWRSPRVNCMVLVSEESKKPIFVSSHLVWEDDLYGKVSSSESIR